MRNAKVFYRLPCSSGENTVKNRQQQGNMYLDTSYTNKDKALQEGDKNGN